MFVLKTLIFTAAWVLIAGQGPNGPTTTPVPILKQINKQNDDGSYSFGYEAADGSFKIETKYPNGDVAGKYGYVDENGKLREISYGASSKRGFEPQGAGIMVPPPTLNEPSTNALTEGQEDDGQYREDPKIYEDPKYNGKARPATFRQYQHASRPEPQQPQYQQIQQPQYQQPEQPQQQYQQSSFQQRSPLYSQQTSLFNQAPQTFPRDSRPQSHIYHQSPQFSYQAYTPQPYQQQSYQQQNYQPQSYQQPQTYQPQTYQTQAYQPQSYQQQNFNPFLGHPAQNFDPNTGSYTIDFTG